MERFVKETFKDEKFYIYRELCHLYSDRMTVSIDGVEQKEYRIHSATSPCEVQLLPLCLRVVAVSFVQFLSIETLFLL